MKKFYFFLSIVIILTLSCKEQYEDEANENLYENIEAREKQEFEKVVSPSLGIVPTYNLYNALDLELANQMNFTLDGVTGVWIERGPNYDSVGNSNSNGRGGGSGYTGAYTAGRMKAFWVDLSDATGNTVFVGGVNGGIWKCTNFLNTTQSPNWQPVADFLDNISIVSICQNPSNPDIMYATTGEGHFAFDVVRGRGVYKSIDHGATWTSVASTIGITKSFKILCDNSGNVYWATYGSGLRRSINGGTTWVTITPNSVGTNCTDIDIDINGKLHASFGYGSNTVFYRYTTTPSTVGAASWTSKTIPTGSCYRMELAVQNDTVYALTASTSANINNVYRSTDGGNNWAKMNSTLFPTTMSSASGNAGQAWYGLGLAINPLDANNIIFGVLDGYVSTDGGTSYSQASYWRGSGVYVHADYHNIHWYKVNGNLKLVIAGDGGLFLSEDNASSFVDRNKNLNLKQFYSCAIHPTLTNYFLAGAQDNGSHQFTKPGLSYTKEVTGGDGGFCAIDQNQPNFQFTSYTNNIYNKSTNGGNSWSQVAISSSGSFINPWAYDDVQNIILAGEGNQTVLRWNNPQTGSTTTSLNITELGVSGSSNVDLACVTISPYTTGRAYLGSSFNGAVLQLNNSKTTSGSSSGDVTSITPSGSIGSDASCIAVGTNDSNLMVTYSNYTVSNVWVSSDAGNSWVSCDGNLPDMPVRWAVFHPSSNKAAIIATELGVYTTDNLNGASTVWVRSPDLPFCRVDMLKLRKSDNTLIAATHGRGLWSTNINNLLPLKKITLNGLVKGENIANINWNMIDATANAKFFVQYSEDGFNFKTVKNTTKEINNFSYSISKEVGYFRIMGYEPGSSPVYSNIIALKSNKAIKGVQINVAPNPMTATGKITLSSTNAGEYNWQICNVQGSVLHIGRGSLNIGTSENINFNFGRLSSGMYLFRVTQNGQTKTVPIIKQ